MLLWRAQGLLKVLSDLSDCRYLYVPEILSGPSNVNHILRGLYWQEALILKYKKRLFSAVFEFNIYVGIDIERVSANA